MMDRWFDKFGCNMKEVLEAVSSLQESEPSLRQIVRLGRANIAKLEGLS